MDTPSEERTPFRRLGFRALRSTGSKLAPQQAGYEEPKSCWTLLEMGGDRCTQCLARTEPSNE